LHDLARTLALHTKGGWRFEATVSASALKALKFHNMFGNSFSKCFLKLFF